MNQFATACILLEGSGSTTLILDKLDTSGGPGNIFVSLNVRNTYELRLRYVFRSGIAG